METFGTKFTLIESFTIVLCSHRWWSLCAENVRKARRVSWYFKFIMRLRVSTKNMIGPVHSTQGPWYFCVGFGMDPNPNDDRLAICSLVGGDGERVLEYSDTKYNSPDRVNNLLTNLRTGPGHTLYSFIYFNFYLSKYVLSSLLFFLIFYLDIL